MKAITLLFVLGLMMTGMINGQTPPLEPGVSQALAKWRAAHYSDVRYKLNITLEKGAPLMRGEIEIRVKLTDEGAKNDLILDWRTTQFANDKDKPYANVVAINEQKIQSIVRGLDSYNYFISNEHLGVSSFLLKTGENVIKINFASPIKTSGAAITRYVDKEDGAECVYSLFVPSDASTAFPVFDQPDLKARFSLSLRVPEKWNVIGNQQSESIGTWIERMNNGTSTIHKFPETKPISTYVFAFAAGELAEFTEYDKQTVLDEMNREWIVKAEETKKARGTDVYPHRPPTTDEEISRKMGARIYVRKSQAEKFKQHSAEVFRLNREGVKFLESYFDYKFPFPKYDLVLIPEFPFGGMEHAGVTFLREASVIFPTEPTKNDYVSRANVIFHEAAHQWFGDTVTMKWFDDLWLKEGFAEFMAYKTLEKVMPEYNAWKIFYERNKQAAYLTDSTKGTTPIYQEIPNLSAAKSAYGNIVYRKAPSFLKQAEFYLGEKEFQTAVRAFLKKHEFANAEWTDLVKEFEVASKQDLKNWSEFWVTKRGLSFITIQRNGMDWDGSKVVNGKNVFVGGGMTNYFFEQENKLNETGNWKQKVKVLVKAQENKSKIIETEINQTKNESFYSTSYGKDLKDNKESIGNPLLIFPNYQDYGYGIFLLDERSRAYVLANIQNEKDDFLRMMMWGSLWDSVREAELAPQDYVELVIKNINTETDESTINTILGRVSMAMNYYLSDNQREELAPRIEALLIDKMQTAATIGQKITFYRAFLNVAASEKARAILKQFDDSKLDIIQTKGFQLKTKDKFDIVTRLLILGDKDAPALLTELEKTETSDEAKRYAYAAKAGIASTENKAKFYNDFVGKKEISESWIEAAFAAFNSPRHADLTLPYLEKALSELPNLKKNRKIFFVNGWLGAFIGGQKSEQALTIVNRFLESNPNLDRDLRLKILENVDGLERAVKIRGKYGK
jgi:aminopeptidase N